VVIVKVAVTVYSREIAISPDVADVREEEVSFDSCFDW
jgi:hypothetical protein